jgi:hypothetical protein
VLPMRSASVVPRICRVSVDVAISSDLYRFHKCCKVIRS